MTFFCLFVVVFFSLKNVNICLLGAGRKQAHMHSSCVGQACSLLRVWVRSERVLGGRVVCGFAGGVGGWGNPPEKVAFRIGPFRVGGLSHWAGCLDKHALQGSLTLWIIAPSPLCGAFLLRLREVMFSAQRRRPRLRKKKRSLHRRLARHAGLPPNPTLRGHF